MRRKVAVFTTRFLPYSQTFIADELRGHERYEPTVFCTERLNSGVDSFSASFSRVECGGRTYIATRLCGRFDHVLETERFDLIHAHFGPAAVYALPFARRHRLPLVVTFHGYDVPLLGSAERMYPWYWPYALLAPAVLRELTLALGASNELCQMLRELGVGADRVRLHHLGIDLARFASDARPVVRERKVVMVGRFVAKKGFVYGVRAFALARRRLGLGRLVVVGAGPRQSELAAAARDEGVAAHVTFAGVLSHAEVASRLATADVLLAPSVTTMDGDRESGTMVIKEAAASGAVPIATWHGGHHEIVDDGRTGYLVAERDVDTMAERLTRLLGDDELRGRMARAGRAKMEAEYDNRSRVAALEDAYDQAVARGARGV